jgi:2',3'-cyclic-nucleotide 2'-phosphodiesterase (5'-nucleotidase family)
MRNILRTVSLQIIISMFFLSLTQHAIAKKKLTILMTSNLEGRFSLDGDQEKSDPFLLLGQDILRDRRKGRFDLYIDLGNAFHPGALSRYSFGSVVSDFFHFFDCRATLISARDIRIGVDNLQFLQKGKKTRFLSANILRNNKPIYTPYFEYTHSGDIVAFIGMSSRKILFDVAEKNVYNISLADEGEALKKTIEVLKSRGIRYIVLLSGLSIERTINLLKSYKEIDAIICGGDNRGQFYGEKMSRIDIADGRTIAFLQKRNGYYLINLLLVKDKIKAGIMRFKPLKYYKTDDHSYREFVNRQLIWKRKFKEEENRVIAQTGEREYILDDSKISNLLRDIFNSEISVIEKNTVNRSVLKGDIRRFELYKIVNNEYSVFTFNLSGSELKEFSAKSEGLIINGYYGERVQGYPVDDNRKYRVSSTQSVYETVKDRLGKDIPYKNNWINISNIIVSDLKGKKILFRDDYGYLERRFRATVDIFISNFFERSLIEKGEEIPTPPGQPKITYRKWGLEDRIDITIYNRYHQFIITPYVYYVEEELKGEDKNYLQNLLRGTFLYNINIDKMVKPYHKSQGDTVIRDVNGQRPAIIRETLGAIIFSTGSFFSIEGNIGAGFEKQVHEPVESPIYGIEAIFKLQLVFLKSFTYYFRVDSFLSNESWDNTIDHLRSEMENSFSYNINTFLSLSLKHKWFYLYKRDFDERYSNSQIIASIDIKTDLKIF